MVECGVGVDRQHTVAEIRQNRGYKIFQFVGALAFALASEL
jgi:hypothetical protein